MKTGTGFFGQASVEDVRLLKKTGGLGLLVKAAGGIGDLSQALALLTAGTDRLGASAGFSPSGARSARV